MSDYLAHVVTGKAEDVIEFYGIRRVVYWNCVQTYVTLCISDVMIIKIEIEIAIF